MIDDDEQIYVVCQGCEQRERVATYSEVKHHEWMRSDAYGLCTGHWCHTCFESDVYPYRRDRYFDPEYCGERMDDDY